MTTASLSAAEEVVHREAWLLDIQDFENWLELFTQECTFWAPALRDDGSYTDDPTRELSLIFYRGKDYLRDRVDRLRAGTSIASIPLPRVVRIIGNVFIEADGEQGAIARSSFVSHAFSPRTDRSSVHFGRYEHRLILRDEGWLIDGKKIFLANDLIPTVLDINAL